MSKTGVGTYVYAYAPYGKPHAVVSADSSVFTYDANGNMENKVEAGLTTNIQWNYDNKPKLFKRNGVNYAEFTYDGNGQRVKKYNHSTQNSVLYFGELYEKRGPEGNQVEIFHVFAGSRRIACVRTDANTQFYHPNHLGSASVVTDSYGIRKEQIEYFPLGEYRAVDDFDTNFPDVFYTLTDQEDDDELGLYNYNARLYDPVLERFISPDSLIPDPGDLQAFNRYTYCLNNPLIYTDPSGEFWWLALLGGTALGAGMSWATGGNIWQGALTGAISGAIFYGAGQVIEGLGPTVTLGEKAWIHAAAGMFSGGINSMITGNDIGLGMVTGVISAGFGAFLGGSIPGVGNQYADFGIQLAGRSLIGGVTGGVVSEMYGGNFGQGFAQGAATAAAGFLFNDTAHWILLKGVGLRVPAWRNTKTGEVRYGQKPDTPDPTMQAVNETLNPYAVGYFGAIGVVGGVLAAPYVAPYALTVGVSAVPYAPGMIEFGTAFLTPGPPSNPASWWSGWGSFFGRFFGPTK